MYASVHDLSRRFDLRYLLSFYFILLCDSQAVSFVLCRRLSCLACFFSFSFSFSDQFLWFSYVIPFAYHDHQVV